MFCETRNILYINENTIIENESTYGACVFLYMVNTDKRREENGNTGNKRSKKKQVVFDKVLQMKQIMKMKMQMLKPFIV